MSSETPSLQYEQRMPAVANPATPGAERLRLLLIEDSVFDAGMIGRLLEQNGFKVELLRVEDEAGLRAALAASPWDAVISDHNLPNFSATEALRIYKDSGLDAPFVIVSGQIGEAVAVEAMLAGADDYVLKSNLGRLPPALRRSLNAAQSRRIRRETEQALSDSESLLRGITSHLPGMVFQLEQVVGQNHWRFRYASEGAQGLLGVTAQSLLENPAGFLDRIEPLDRMRLGELLAHGTQDLCSVRWTGQVTPAADGQAAWIALACKPHLAAPATLLWEGVIVDITAQKMAAQALAASREELRALTMHIETVREEERKSISREIHDDIGAILTSLKFELASLQSQTDIPEAVSIRLDAMASMVMSAQVASDRIMRNLRPSILDQGIVAALEWQARQFTGIYGIECRFQSNQERIALPEDRCTAMFRICQEALTNIAKHANASQVRIELFANTKSATIEISDNGSGITSAALDSSERFGIRGIRERAAGLGGWVEIHGSPSAGTTIMLSLPSAESKTK